MYQKFFAVLILLALFAWVSPAWAAGGGADYGRGPETDPIAVPILSTATTDVAAIKASTNALNTRMGATEITLAATTGAVAVIQAGTGTWNQAATDGASATGNVATLQGQMTAVQNRTGTWNQAATDGSTATSAIPRIASMEGRTGTWNQAATDASSATGNVATLQASVWGSPGITPSTNLLVNTVTIQTKNLAAGNLTGYRVLHVWISGTALGAASTNNIESLTLSTGTAIATVTAAADYWYCTAAAGSAVATVTASAAGTNYLMVADGSTVNSAAVVFE